MPELYPHANKPCLSIFLSVHIMYLVIANPPYQLDLMYWCMKLYTVTVYPPVLPSVCLSILLVSATPPDEPELMKLYTVVVYNLRMVTMEDNPGPKYKRRSFKGDNLQCWTRGMWPFVNRIHLLLITGGLKGRHIYLLYVFNNT